MKKLILLSVYFIVFSPLHCMYQKPAQQNARFMLSTCDELLLYKSMFEKKPYSMSIAQLLGESAAKLIQQTDTLGTYLALAKTDDLLQTLKNVAHKCTNSANKLHTGLALGDDYKKDDLEKLVVETRQSLALLFISIQQSQHYLKTLAQ